jgi:hypothetical protein
MAQAVSRRPLTVEVRVRSRVSPCWIYGGQSGTEQVFSRALRFTLSISFHPCSITWKNEKYRPKCMFNINLWCMNHFVYLYVSKVPSTVLDTVLEHPQYLSFPQNKTLISLPLNEPSKLQPSVFQCF